MEYGECAQCDGRSLVKFQCVALVAFACKRSLCVVVANATHQEEKKSLFGVTFLFFGTLFVYYKQTH